MYLMVSVLWFSSLVLGVSSPILSLATQYADIGLLPETPVY
jgi:hypothetical protein